MSVQLRQRDEGSATVDALRARAAAIRQGELRKAFGHLGRLTAAERQTVTALATAITDGILSSPFRRLGAGDADAYDAVLRELFGLDAETASERCGRG